MTCDSFTFQCHSKELSCNWHWYTNEWYYKGYILEVKHIIGCSQVKGMYGPIVQIHRCGEFVGIQLLSSFLIVSHVRKCVQTDIGVWNLVIGKLRLQWTSTRECHRDHVCCYKRAILRMRRVLNVRRHIHYPNLECQIDRFHVVLR